MRFMCTTRKSRNSCNVHAVIVEDTLQCACLLRLAQDHRKSRRPAVWATSGNHRRTHKPQPTCDLFCVALNLLPVFVCCCDMRHGCCRIHRHASQQTQGLKKTRSFVSRAPQAPQAPRGLQVPHTSLATKQWYKHAVLSRDPTGATGAIGASSGDAPQSRLTKKNMASTLQFRVASSTSATGATGTATSATVPPRNLPSRVLSQERTTKKQNNKPSQDARPLQSGVLHGQALVL